MWPKVVVFTLSISLILNISAPVDTQRLPAGGMQRSASQLEGKNLRSPKMEPRQKSCDDFLRSTNGRNSSARRQPKRPVASQRKI